VIEQIGQKHAKRSAIGRYNIWAIATPPPPSGTGPLHRATHLKGFDEGGLHVNNPPFPFVSYQISLYTASRALRACRLMAVKTERYLKGICTRQRGDRREKTDKQSKRYRNVETRSQTQAVTPEQFGNRIGGGDFGGERGERGKSRRSEYIPGDDPDGHLFYRKAFS